MNDNHGTVCACFVTSDWILVSSLSLLGFPIRATERDERGRVVFHLKKTEDLDAAIQSFWLREIRVEPQEFSRHMKFVKARMYDGN